jgi:P4 family phage/plasmid primase-like protien
MATYLISISTEENDLTPLVNAINLYMINMRSKFNSVDAHIHFCEGYFKVSKEEFFDKMDENHDLLGFENGIYDLKNNVFRDGQPEDLVSLSVGYDFPKQSDPIIRANIEKFFTDIFKDGEDVEYTKNVLSYLLNGSRHREKFNIWIGNTRNGKGTLIELLKTCVGNYLTEIDPDLFCDSRNKAGQANSEMAKAKGRRVLIASEPDGDKKIQNSLIKRYTGGDKINARHLYGDSFEYVPQFHIIVQTNNVPDVQGLDSAFCKRVEMTEFPFCFVEQPTQSFEKLRDNNVKLNFKLLEYGQELMLILLENYYSNNVMNGFKTSKNSLEKTQEYTDEIDKVPQFIKNFYIMTDNDKDRIKPRELYCEFKSAGGDLSERNFSNDMIRIGISKRKIGGAIYYLRLKRAEQENDGTSDDDSKLNTSVNLFEF